MKLRALALAATIGTVGLTSVACAARDVKPLTGLGQTIGVVDCNSGDIKFDEKPGLAYPADKWLSQNTIRQGLEEEMKAEGWEAGAAAIGMAMLNGFVDESCAA